MLEEKCCTVTCGIPLNKTYWDNQYQAHNIGWDLGEVSPPIKSYIDKLQDKGMAILIPGCGNCYEAEYLLQQGFTNITIIDIAPTLVNTLKNKFKNSAAISIVLGNFFEHLGKYDLIIEQTFFCALPPNLRQKYIWKMHQLLTEDGLLAGLLFNRKFEISPPFGGNQTQYEKLFQKAFVFNSLNIASNSVPSRANAELFIEFQKNNFVQVNLYHFKGITCIGCMNTVTNKFFEIDGVMNVSMNTDFSEILMVTKKEIPLKKLREMVSYDEKYKINKPKKQER